MFSIKGLSLHFFHIFWILFGNLKNDSSPGGGLTLTISQGITVLQKGLKG
jgi:hypothetical protein